MTAALVHAVALYGAAVLAVVLALIVFWVAVHGAPADVHLSDWP